MTDESLDAARDTLVTFLVSLVVLYLRCFEIVVVQNFEPVASQNYHLKNKIPLNTVRVSDNPSFKINNYESQALIASLIFIYLQSESE